MGSKREKKRTAWPRQIRRVLGVENGISPLPISLWGVSGHVEKTGGGMLAGETGACSKLERDHGAMEEGLLRVTDACGRIALQKTSPPPPEERQAASSPGQPWEGRAGRNPSQTTERRPKQPGPATLLLELGHRTQGHPDRPGSHSIARQEWARRSLWQGSTLAGQQADLSLQRRRSAQNRSCGSPRNLESPVTRSACVPLTCCHPHPG